MRAIFVALTIVVALATPAAAKVPPFDVDASTDGTRATLTLTFGTLENHPPARVEVTEGLIGLLPADRVNADGRPLSRGEALMVDFEADKAGNLVATVDLPQAGEWVAVPFPEDLGQVPAAYRTTTFTVVDVGATTTAPNVAPAAPLGATVSESATTVPVVPVATAVVLVGAAAAVGLIVWKRRPQPAAAGRHT